jgi:hypothetical protein
MVDNLNCFFAFKSKDQNAVCKAKHYYHYLDYFENIALKNLGNRNYIVQPSFKPNPRLEVVEHRRHHFGIRLKYFTYLQEFVHMDSIIAVVIKL